MIFFMIFLILWFMAIFFAIYAHQYVFTRYYKHYKGSIYRVVESTASLESDPVIDHIVYKSVTNGKVWIRKRAEFYGMVEDGFGNKFYRFERISVFSYWRYELRRFFQRDNELP